MENERRKVQMFTTGQAEELRTYLAQKGNELPPLPERFMIGEIIRAVYPELKNLRENGYSLKALARVLEEKGVVITASALSSYMAKLALSKGEPQTRAVSKGNSMASSNVEARRGQFQMKADVSL